MYIKIKNASHHNLNNISVDIPRNKLTLITGVSGSGKSTLAFDTLYAEGQRRFVESLSSYARQFLERMTKPNVESITGLPPAIAIEQKSPPKNPRSTVGTVTEIYDFVRALYARVGETHCVKCGKIIQVDNPQNVLNQIINSDNFDDKIYILLELRHNIKNVPKELDHFVKLGFTRVVPKNSDEIIDINDLKVTVSTKNTDYFILIDRIVIDNEQDTKTRIADSLETAFSTNSEKIIIRNLTKHTETKYSSNYECADCNIKYEVPTPRLFAFNSPQGACPHCQGLGQIYGIDENLVVPDKTLSLEQHCIQPYNSSATTSVFTAMINVCKKYGVPTNIPYNQLSTYDKDIIWDGKDKYFGVYEYFNYLENNYKIKNKILIANYSGLATCMKCEGSRLGLSARQVYVKGKNIPEIVNMQISDLYDWLNNLKFTKYEHQATELIMQELINRTKMLVDIGLEYLTLSRSCFTLSGGEYQRINLSTALGSTLVGTLYVLDEPSIGMHDKDTAKLMDILYRLRNIGNTIVVVEHDLEIIRKADYIIDMGIGAGVFGGNIVNAGTYKELLKNETSLTSNYLTNIKQIEVPTVRRDQTDKKIVIKNATENNLKIETLSIPLNNFVVVTGVSGSGKSSLVYNVLYSGILEQKGLLTKNLKIGKYGEILGVDFIDGVNIVDQTPIGKSTRSTPATYMKVFDYIREFFAQQRSAVQLGLKAGYFSFNVPGGRCEACEGEGYVNIDMQFLPDIRMVCEECGGTRYKPEIGNITYKDKSIIDVLNMSVDEAIEYFYEIDKIAKRLQILKSVGLGYIKLGQSSSALSGGEAQRIKLASHIDSVEYIHTLYIFDEPTTGLHIDDIAKLIDTLNKLIDKGNSVVIIEHNLNVISVADWIIDLGPEAGYKGGSVVGEGTPEHIATLNTHTGFALRKININ